MRWRRGGLILAWVVALAGCGDLPSASEDPVRLELRLRIPDSIFVFERSLFQADALDPEGRKVADAPIRWRLSSSYPLQAVNVSPEGLLVEATEYDSTTVRAWLERSDGRFVAEAVEQRIGTTYMGPFDLSFVDVGRDTVITSGGQISFHARALEGHGQPMRRGEYLLDGSPEWSLDWDRVSASVMADSMDLEAVIRHTLAPGAADTLTVRVRRQVAAVALPGVTLTSLGDTAMLEPRATDARGYTFADDVTTLTLADPADTAVIGLSGREVVARTAGTARVVAIAGGFQDTAVVAVEPIARTLAIHGVPSSLDYLGATTEVTAVAFDARGNPVVEPAGPTEWNVEGSTITAVSSGPHSATITAVAAGTSTLAARVPGCDAGCPFAVAAVPVTVVPQLDSVTVSAAFDTLTFLGATTQLTLTGFYQGATIAGLPATWTALDPATAIVDSVGLVTAVQVGSARFVGAVSGHVDTATVVVRQVPSRVHIDSVPALITGVVDTLTAALYDGGGSPIPGFTVTWSSDAPGTVAVDANGVITAGGEGHATITVTIGGASGQIMVVSLDPAYTLMPSNDDVCVVAAGGTVYCGIDGLRPVRLSPATRLIEGAGSYCALGGLGGARCMGNNEDGQLGVGHRNYVDIPTPILTPDTLVSLAVVGEGGGYAHSCGIARDGRALCWGEEWHYHLGTAGLRAYQTYPVEVQTDLRFTAIALHDGRTCGIGTDRAGYCWGQVGLVETHEPQRITGADDLAGIASGAGFFCGLTAAGEVRCWGENYFGQLGDGSYAERWAAAPVAGNHRFLALDAGRRHACGLTDVHTLMCWGYNADAQLGDGTFNWSPQPVLALAGRTFTALAVGSAFTAARDAAGELVLWGEPTALDRAPGAPPPALRTLVKAPGG